MNVKVCGVQFGGLCCFALLFFFSDRVVSDTVIDRFCLYYLFVLSRNGVNDLCVPLDEAVKMVPF